MYEFFAQLANGFNLGPKSPVLKLRECLRSRNIMPKQHRPSQTYINLTIAAAIIKAWNAYVAGRGVSFAWKAGEPDQRTFSYVNSMLRPVLECLQRELKLQKLLDGQAPGDERDGDEAVLDEFLADLRTHVVDATQFDGRIVRAQCADNFLEFLLRGIEEARKIVTGGRPGCVEGQSDALGYLAEAG